MKDKVLQLHGISPHTPCACVVGLGLSTEDQKNFRPERGGELGRRSCLRSAPAGITSERMQVGWKWELPDAAKQEQR